MTTTKLSPKQVREKFGLSLGFLREDRKKPTPEIPFTQLGYKTIQYDSADVDAFLLSKKKGAETSPELKMPTEEPMKPLVEAIEGLRQDFRNVSPVFLDRLKKAETLSEGKRKNVKVRKGRGKNAQELATQLFVKS